MSWISKFTHTEGWTPTFIKKAGDSVAGTVVNAIPGGSYLDSIFDLTNTRGGVAPSSIVQQTGDNLNASLTVAQRAGQAQAQTQQLMAGLNSPLGIGLLVGGAVLLLGKGKG